jgi:pilus assembly protein Flp/PilA
MKQRQNHLGELIMLYRPQEEGQGLVEYALILVLVAIAVILILTVLGEEVGAIFQDIVDGLGDAEQVQPVP